MADPDELVGLWDSALYGYGAMESSTVALVADGTGWATWENVAGGSEVQHPWPSYTSSAAPETATVGHST